MRVQNPQTNGYVIGITIFHRDSTAEIQEVLLGSVLEGVSVHGEGEVRVRPADSRHFLYGQISELVLGAGDKNPD